jgi:thiol-disulfide isomerase/thioredoxin
MKRLVLLFGLLPILAVAQPNLTGTWRLKESKLIKGANYLNAIPITITIEQKPGIIILETTSDLGDRDTVVKESINYVGIQTTITKSGKKKSIFFKETKENNGWLKQTEIFSKEDSGKLQSVNKETLSLGSNGTVLSLLREYDNNEDPKGNNEDFVISGTYEKITPEQLAKETAIGKGINFTEGLTWEQVKAKAKKENKYIFVDCYATWCGPCKVMDKYVYPLNMVGDEMNEQFISIRVQMDSTKNDPGSVKTFYPLARKLEKEYNIMGLPCYLFFSPEGKVAHKGMGKLDAKDFIKLLAKAKDPQQQLYTLFEKAKQQRLPWNEYPVLAKRLKEEFGEKALAKEVAAIYNSQYLNKLREKELLTKSNLDFIGEYVSIVNSTDQIFQWCFKQPDLVDTIKEYHGGGWADYIVNRTINREEIDPILNDAEKSSKEPNWIKLEKLLSKRYNRDLAKTYTLDARVNWYIKRKNWTAYIKFIRQQLDRHDLKKMNQDILHWNAWYVFLHSVDPMLMKEALGWMDIILNNEPGSMFAMMLDTKACLLYKMGRKYEAIDILKKVQQLDPPNSKMYQSRIDSMNKGEALWLIID